MNRGNEIDGIDIGDLKQKGFKIHKVALHTAPQFTRGRRDFYKLGLVKGNSTVYHGDEAIEMNGTVLFFVNPNKPHRVVHHSKKLSGYACLFTEAFITGRERTEIFKNSPLCNADARPVIKLNKQEAEFIIGLFEKMQHVYESNYDYKNELLKSCIELIINEALRIAPPQNSAHHKNGATRITHLFMDLLDRQFPVETTQRPLKLRTAQAFAANLSVHVNYLNRSVKGVTGKPISAHITQRIVAEAKALLQYTDWSVADIAYALGFEYPTYFNNYFKRATGTTPQAARKEKV